jgi:hypothetical protein
MNTDCISPFEIEIPSEVLSDLHRRLTITRWHFVSNDRPKPGFCTAASPETRVMFYAEATRVDSDQAGRLQGIRLYWALKDIRKTTEPLQEVEALDRLCTKQCEIKRRLA